MSGQLARMLAAGSQPGARLALTAPLIAVGVLWRQFMAPLAAGLETVEGGVVARLLVPLGYQPSAGAGLEAPHCSQRVFARIIQQRFPVRRVLAGAMLARVATWALRVPVMARVIHDLAGLERAHKRLEAVAVRRVAFPAGVDPVVLLSASSRPWPAVARSPLVNVGEISLKPRHAPAQRAAPDARFLPLLIVRLAQPLRLCWRRLVAFGADSPLALMAWLKRIPILPEPVVVSNTQSSDVRRLLAVLTVRHSTILQWSAYKGVVPRHVI